MAKQGDPDKEKVGTTGPTPEGEPDAAAEAGKAEAEQKAAEEAAAAGARADEAETPVDEEAGRPKRGRPRKRPEPKQVPESRKSAEDVEREAELEERAPEEVAAEADTAGAPEQKAAEEEVPEEEAPEEELARRRRGAAETTTAQPTPAPARRAPDGTVVVRARAKYVRCAPRKARLVIEHIRGKPVDEARALLQHTPRAASQDVLKLLESAIANAENNHELVADELKVHQAYVDEGPTLKRYRPRALGRATRIRKRTSHMTITLTPRD